MPLRAILNEEEIHAYLHSDEQWKELKGSERRRDLRMPCCDTKAIPKTSKLGTQYFAHHKRGSCTSSPESAEHLHLKALVAQAATNAGWQVVTEYRGKTPDGESWVADVFCMKGNANVAIEIQWSSQSKEEFERRQERYTASNVRCAWLYRLVSNRGYCDEDLSSTRSLPIFGFRKSEDGLDFYIPKFGLHVLDFKRGMLSGKLAWLPKEKQSLDVNLYPYEDICWRCKRSTTVITEIEVCISDYGTLETFSLAGNEAASWVRSYVSIQELNLHNVGEIKLRSSKTTGTSYLSNGCINCGALMGAFYLQEASIEMWHSNENPSPLITKAWRYNPNELHIKGNWYFQGVKGRRYTY